MNVTESGQENTQQFNEVKKDQPTYYLVKSDEI